MIMTKILPQILFVLTADVFNREVLLVKHQVEVHKKSLKILTFVETM